MYVKKTKLLICFYVLIALLFWFTIGIYVMQGEINFKFYSDSKTYEAIALSTNNVIGLLRVSGNEFGPVLLCKLIGPKNYTLLFFFNTIILLISLRILLLDNELNKMKFLFLLLMCPLLFSSLFAINKEIISFLCIAFFVRYIEIKNKWWLLFALILSFFVRWQLTLFFAIISITFTQPKIILRKRFTFLILFISLVTGLLFVTRNSLLIDVFNKADGNKYKEGSGIFNSIMTIQDTYGYIFAFIPKVLHLLVGMTTRISHVFNPDPFEMYNDVILYWQGPINIYLLFTIFRKKLINLQNIYIFVIFIYLIIFAITPIYNIRYFYPVTVFMCIIVSKKTIKIDKIKNLI